MVVVAVIDICRSLPRRLAKWMVVVVLLLTCRRAYTFNIHLPIIRSIHPLYSMTKATKISNGSFVGDYHQLQNAAEQYNGNEQQQQQQQQQPLQRLWQSAKFNTIDYVLDQIFSPAISTTTTTTTTTATTTNTTTITSQVQSTPLLRRLDHHERLENTPSETYAHFFFPLFNTTTLNDNDESLLHTTFNNPPTKRSTKTATMSFRLDIRYRGDFYCGWQRQQQQQQQQNHDSLPAVQQVLEDWLQTLQPVMDPPKPVDVRVCGRTDAGVHALSQICRFRTNDNNLSPFHILRHINQSPWRSSLQCTQVTKVSSKFHPTFGATCRAYAYLLDWDDTLLGCSSVIMVERLNTLLQPLLHQQLDYYSMSYGPVTTQSTNCTIFRASVCRVQLTMRDNKITNSSSSSSNCVDDTASQVVALLFQFVANRFLRRMVRILVATALQYALEDTSWSSTNSSYHHDGLWKLLQQQNRRASAKPAPARGLVLMGADFEEPLR